MGCFNSSGFISQLPIKYGDKVVCFIATFAVENNISAPVVIGNKLTELEKREVEEEEE